MTLCLGSCIFGVSDVKYGRILGANKIMVRASVGGGGPDGVG